MSKLERVEGIVPLVGWRGFQLLKPCHLYSGGQLVVPCQVNEAICQMHHTHSAPEDNCSCGFYAFKEAKQLVEQSYDTQPIIGEVWLYGKVVEHAGGFRAARMYPKRLWWNQQTYGDSKAYWLPLLGWMAHQYGCEILVEGNPLHELQAAKIEADRLKEVENARRQALDKKDRQREYNRERNARLKQERLELEARNRLLEAAARKAGLKVEEL